MSEWFVNDLVCPLDHQTFTLQTNRLVCAAGHAFPVVEGIPVLLLDGVDQTIPVAEDSIRMARDGAADPLWLESVGLSAEERAQIARLAQIPSKIDPVISFLVGATNGIAYRHLIGKLGTYPIPELRLPDGQGRTLLDIGCNWGRWCIAAARKNYQPIGLDPSLGAVMAARRASLSMGLSIRFVVGDARHLPFKRGTVDTVFSYSVVQHFSRPDAARAIAEIGRVLAPGGTSLVQMPTRWGVRCLYHQMRRRFAEATGFDVRYYGVPELRKLFSSRIGKTGVSVDCYFGIGLQPSDWKWMPWKVKGAIAVSEVLRFFSGALFPLRYLADSVYLSSRKSA